MKKLITTLITAIGITASALGANLDIDDASADAYVNGWNATFPIWSLDGSVANPPPSSGGFGGWSITTVPNSSASIASAAALNSGASLLDVASSSFRLSGGFYSTDGGVSYTGAVARATRYLDPSGLDEGQTFTFQMAVNFRNGNKGVDIRDVNGVNIFNFNIGGDDYRVNNATTGSGSIGNSYSSNTLFTIELEQTSLLGGSWTITRAGGVSDIDTGTYEGVVRSASWYAGASTSNGSLDALFFNNLSIIPEPNIQSLLCVALLVFNNIMRKVR